jgi:hypothetical protein
MVFVPGHKGAIFISYAHADDRPVDVTEPDQASGWATTLVRHLGKYLAQEIGRHEAFNIGRTRTIYTATTLSLQRSQLFIHLDSFLCFATAIE